MGSDIAIPLDSGWKSGKTSFHYSFSFLPKRKRDALRTVYAFCRTTDDIVDNANDTQSKIEVLHKWRTEFEQALHGSSHYHILNMLNETAVKFGIPVIHFYDLLRGVEIDLLKNRYNTFEELKEYCYLVASSVGLMSLGIFGPNNEKTKEYAINLGIALQLTNIIRDVAADAQYGRIYIPLDEMKNFGYSEKDLFAHRYNDAFISLMEFQTNRAEEYYARARKCLPKEDLRAMFAAKIMERIYYHMLIRIRENKYNVFSRRISLPRITQVLIALKYWMKQRIFGM
jgi:15-cis-phytoene synthase